jgi:hypothetical protein
MIDKFDVLVSKSVELGNSFPIMPIEEIRLAVAFAELPNQEVVVSRLLHEIFHHENMHVRRIAVNACRRSNHFQVSGLKEALTTKLSDPEAWVCYDAAWAIFDAQFDSPEIRESLNKLADGISLSDGKALLQSNLGDAELQAKVKAKEVLTAILANN